MSLGGICVPEEGWYDSVLVVLTWWAEAVARSRQTGEIVQFLFMEGPFEIELTPVPHRTELDVAAWRRTARGRARISSAIVSRTKVDGEVTRVSEQVIEFCRAHNWTSSDLEKLTAHIAPM